MSVTLTLELPDEPAERLGDYARRFHTELHEVILTAVLQRAEQYEQFDKLGVLPVNAKVAPHRNGIKSEEDSDSSEETFEQLLQDLYSFTADPANAIQDLDQYDRVMPNSQLAH